MACTATWGSLAHAWMHRSPSLRSGSMKSFTNVGSSVNSVGILSAMPKRSVPSAARKSVGPNPNVPVSPLGPRSAASPVSSGG